MHLSQSGQSRLYVWSGDGQSAVRHHARAPAPARKQLPRDNIHKGLRLPQLSARLAVLGMVRHALFFHSLLYHSLSLLSSIVLVVRVTFKLFSVSVSSLLLLFILILHVFIVIFVSCSSFSFSSSLPLLFAPYRLNSNATVRNYTDTYAAMLSGIYQQIIDEYGNTTRWSNFDLHYFNMDFEKIIQTWQGKKPKSST